MERQINNERVIDHSRRIKMLEEVFVPMAKASMKILTGENGNPGMDETVRSMSARIDQLLGWKDQQQLVANELAKEKRGEWRKYIYGVAFFILGYGMDWLRDLLR